MHLTSRTVSEKAITVDPSPSLTLTHSPLRTVLRITAVRSLRGMNQHVFQTVSLDALCVGQFVNYLFPDRHQWTRDTYCSVPAMDCTYCNRAVMRGHISR